VKRNQEPFIAEDLWSYAEVQSQALHIKCVCEHLPHGGKEGVKRSLLTEGQGVPIGLAVAGANRTDMKLVRTTLERIVIERPAPTLEQPQGMCLDKGFDSKRYATFWLSLASPPIFGLAAKRPKPSNAKPVSGRGAGWSNEAIVG
jgi:hypothetical protein